MGWRVLPERRGLPLTWSWLAVVLVVAAPLIAAVEWKRHAMGLPLPLVRSSVLFDPAPAQRYSYRLTFWLSQLYQIRETATVLTGRALKPTAEMREAATRQHFRDNPWDPGFGPHHQTVSNDPKIVAVLSCWPPDLVCCDPCQMCTCERGGRRCSVIGLMDRRHCRPGFEWGDDD